MASNYSTAGVYINEVNGFANSDVPIATAVPAFIGYTPRADYQASRTMTSRKRSLRSQSFRHSSC